MSVNENIRVNIQDDELDAIISKLSNAKLAGGGADDATKRLNELNKKIADTIKASKEAGINLEDLPTMNRDVRLLLGTLNLPGFREFSAGFFQTRRGIRAEVNRRVAEGLIKEDLAPQLAKELQIQSMVGYAALILFVTKMIYEIVQGEIDRIEKKREAFENFIRKDTELTNRQFRELQSEQIGFATWFDQLQAKIDDEGFAAGMADLVIDRLLGMQVSLYPPGSIPEAPYRPPTGINPGEVQ